MTLGLATADNSAIYLAIESSGSPNKAIVVSDSPKIVLLISNLLSCWLNITSLKGLYNGKPLTDKIAEDLKNKLHASTSTQGKDAEAFGLLCGYNNDLPTCYRYHSVLPDISKPPDTSVSIGLNLTSDVQELGAQPYAALAKDRAKLLINSGTSPQCALEVSITEQVVLCIQNNDTFKGEIKLKMPINHETIKRT
jgi:hypothetical protein